MLESVLNDVLDACRRPETTGTSTCECCSRRQMVERSVPWPYTFSGRWGWWRPSACTSTSLPNFLSRWSTATSSIPTIMSCALHLCCRCISPLRLHYDLLAALPMVTSKSAVTAKMLWCDSNSIAHVLAAVCLWEAFCTVIVITSPLTTPDQSGPELCWHT